MRTSVVTSSAQEFYLKPSVGFLQFWYPQDLFKNGLIAENLITGVAMALLGMMPQNEAISTGALKIDGDASVLEKLLANIGKDNPNFAISTK